jgi:UDP-GlcNAc:undecaprenyl-phosphate GlcNAc-1-phosphate transferase
MTVAAAFFLLVWLGFCLMLLRHTLLFLIEHGLVRMNYRMERIPVGLGLYLWICSFLQLFLLEMWEAAGVKLPAWLGNAGLRYYFMLTVIFLIGWMDDTIGEEKVKGLRGHLSRFFHDGVITTGLAKAGVTAMLSAWSAVMIGGSGLHQVISFGVILLTTNTMNMLDLRPGRALKAYFTLAALLAFVGTSTAIPYLLPVLLGAILIFAYDLKARAMLGDMGSNLIGFCLGFTASAVLPWWGLVLWFCAAAALQWAAEKVSLTKVIDQNPVLAWLDQAGRGSK